MKYEVTFSCGHTETIELFGKTADRERKIAYYEKYGVCSECYKEQKNVENSRGCDEMRMSYRDYKTKYASCKTKSGSYDASEKTVVVYVPKKSADKKITKSVIFKTAHEWAHHLTKQYAGTSYSANFSQALKEIYRQLKSAKMAA